MNEEALFALMGDKAKFTKKITIAAIVLVVVAIIVILIVKYKGKLSDTIKNRTLAESLDEEIDQDNITLTQMQLNTYASSLYAAMKGAGTNENKIYSVFRGLGTRSDVLQLIKTFGVKDGMTLTEWMNDDLSSKEIDKINSILANNNINYQF